MSELSDKHYLRAVTELGDVRKIVANRDIYSQSGMKLVAAGVHITSGMYDRLVKHRLLSFDNALSIDDMLDSEGILADLHALIGIDSLLKRMSDVINNGRLDRLILAIRLPATLAFKLTVAREKYRDIYQHSLSFLVIGVYLARCDAMNLREQTWVATAALFHDIGLIHIDPELLSPSHVMNNAERRHLYTHPLTAYLLLCEFPELPSQIADAVLEHHERMDGSGYPRGLPGDKISRYGQILAIAELAVKAFDSNYPKVPWEKLEVMLRLNSRQYGQGLIGYLNILRESNPADMPSSVEDPGPLVAQIQLVSKLFADFNQHSDPGQSDKIFDLAKTRLTALKLELFDAGFDPRDPAALTQLFTDDPECMTDYVPLLNETLWQFKTLLSEISRLWPERVDEKDRQLESPVWLNEMTQSLLNADIGS